MKTDYVCVKLTMPDECKCKSCVKERANPTPKKPRVLLITGIHGNEERSKKIVEDYLARYQVVNNYDIFVYNFETGFNTRDVHFNLNRMDQVEKLNILANNILSLKENIRKADIVIDIHNTPICENKLLVTTESLETLPKWKTYSDEYHDMVIWRLSKFESLSEFARKLGKIAFTAEFGGMISNEEVTPPNDLLFLRDSIELCMDLFEMRNFQEPEDSENPSILIKPLFTEFNRLVEVELNQKTFLYPGQLISGERVVCLNSDIDINIINASLESYNYKVVSPEANYSNKFEGTIRKVKELK